MELPIYLQIVEEIKDKIKKGLLSPGDAIPSENALCETYKVSRMTVRKGLAVLVNEGYITSIPGKGSYVNEPDSERYILHYNEMSNMINSVDSTKLIEANIVLPTAHLTNALNISSNRKIISIKRVLFSGREPVAFDQKYLIYYKGMPIIEKEIKYRTFPEMISKFTSLFAIKKDLTITAQLPNEEVAKHLALYNTVPLLVVEQKLFNNENKPFGLGITYYRGDYCKLSANSSFSDSD